MACGEVHAFIIVAVGSAVAVIVEFVIADFSDRGGTCVEIDRAVVVAGDCSGFEDEHPFAASRFIEHERGFVAFFLAIDDAVAAYCLGFAYLIRDTIGIIAVDLAVAVIVYFVVADFIGHDHGFLTRAVVDFAVFSACDTA